MSVAVEETSQHVPGWGCESVSIVASERGRFEGGGAGKEGGREGEGAHGGREEDDEAVRFGEGGELGTFEVYLRGAGADCGTLRQT